MFVSGNGACELSWRLDNVELTGRRSAQSAEETQQRSCLAVRVERRLRADVSWVMYWEHVVLPLTQAEDEKGITDGRFHSPQSRR